MDSIVVAALYRFVPVRDYQQRQQPLLARMKALGVRGSVLLASEGINGTIAGTREAIDSMIAYLRADPLFAALEVKESTCDEIPFKRSRVRLKKEIVTMGVEEINPLDAVGTYVEPGDWNALLDDPDVTLIDTRNDYEVSIGTFRGATNPETHTFREFPDYAQRQLDPQKHAKVAMFCTGGIRCEKATALLKQRGFKEVYHLRGGILKYLEQVPESESYWRGECFVFDGRVSVGHGLEVGPHELCFGCGWPVTEEQQRHPDFERGVSCPNCADATTDQQKARFRERQRQLDAQAGQTPIDRS